ncbi:ATP synthase F1 subunit delta [Balneola vulgaris]|uniref:ATP synthase F1 subunit delta n=1 Tax=Balneola vulgaris TaxID=287535 RepID=UPI00035CC726|nr:ATP synthase F1 subunit delta [Balneola vulgaris]
MLVSKSARRYAVALLGVSKEQNSLDTVLEDILTIQATLVGSKELVNFLKSPIVKPDDKKAALSAIFSDKVSKLVSQFIDLVAQKGRENILFEITKSFVDVYNKDAGIITVEVKSAKQLGDSQVIELTKMLERTTSKKVNLSLKEEADLKGGISVKIGDTVFDATVKHKLEQLENKFLASSVE